MNILYELEVMRKRILQEINTEFDVLIDRVSKENQIENPKEFPQPYEISYPLTIGSGMFKGKKPTKVVVEENVIRVNTWKQLVETVIKKCMETEKYNKSLYELSGNISGKKRVLLAATSDNMRSPLKLDEKLYMETHYDTETLLNILISRILTPIGYDCSSISVTIRNT